MFCSDTCCKQYFRKNNEPASGSPYRANANMAGEVRSFYKEIAKKDMFCVLCGKTTHKPKETNSIFFGSLLMFATLVPIGGVSITSNSQRSVVTTVYA